MSIWIVGISLVLGLGFNWLVYGSAVGLGFFIETLGLVAGLLLLARRQNVKVPTSAKWLLAAIVFFASMTIVRDSDELTFLNVVISIFLLFLVARVMQGERLTNFRIENYIGSLSVPFQAMAASPATFADVLREQGRTNDRGAVVRGLLITVPVVAFFLILFAAADAVFLQSMWWLRQIIEAIDAEVVFRTILVALFTIGFTGAYTFSFGKPRTPNGETAATVNRIRLGQTELTMLYGALNILFFVFIFFQISYLFGGARNIIIEGMTYAEYARQGFGELVVAALATLLLLVITSRFVEGSDTAHRQRFAWLGSALAVQVFVIMASAFKRLLLYEGAYGFTPARFYAHVLIIGVAIIFMLLIWKLVRQESEPVFAFRAFVTCLVIVGFLNLMNPDAFVAQYNLQRHATTGKLDTWALVNLSDDALPTILAERPLVEMGLRDLKKEFIKEYHPTDVSPVIPGNWSDGRSTESQSKWQAFNFSRRRADALLEQAVPELRRNLQEF